MQNDGFVDKFGSATLRENSSSHNQVIEKNFADSIGKEVDSVLAATESRVHGTIFTAMNSVVMSRVEMAMRSISGSSGHGPSSVVETPDKSFSGDLEDTPLLTASILTDLNINNNRKDETRNSENVEAIFRY